MKKPCYGDTGNIRCHHQDMPKGKDKNAHPTHDKMNKAHGTPMGHGADPEYGEGVAEDMQGMHENSEYSE